MQYSPSGALSFGDAISGRFPLIIYSLSLSLSLLTTWIRAFCPLFVCVCFLLNHFLSLTFTAPSTKPAHVWIQPLSAHSLKILWKPPVFTSIPQRIDGYSVGFREINDYRLSPGSDNPFTYKDLNIAALNQQQSSELSTELNNLKRNTRYGIVVRPFNRRGTGPMSGEIFGQTMEYGKYLYNVQAIQA